MSAMRPVRGSCTIFVNGKEHVIPAGLSLDDLLQLLGNTSPATATAVNGIFVPRDGRANCLLEAGDQVHCFQVITGG